MKLRSLIPLLLAGCACGPTDSRCRAKPEADANFGTCMQIIGAYYDARSNSCAEASGCGCDEACRDQVPFTTLAACEDVCE